MHRILTSLLLVLAGLLAAAVLALTPPPARPTVLPADTADQPVLSLVVLPDRPCWSCLLRPCKRLRAR